MDKLPLEIVTNIASFLPTRDLGENGQRVRPSIASLSRAWQSVMEPDVFRELNIKHTELDDFAAVFSTSQAHRRTLLRTLYFSIVLPTYTDEQCAVYETNQDRAANDKVASEAVSALFDVLSAWGGSESSDLTLLIRIHSPMDGRHRGLDKLRQDRHDSIISRREDLFHRRYKYSYIRLTDTDKLPEIPCVSALFAQGGDRELHPSCQAALTAKLTSLKKVDWQYTEPGVYVPLQRQIREELVQSLENLRVDPAVTSFHLDVTSHKYLHHQRLPNLAFPHEQDPLSSVLHHYIGSGEKLINVRYDGTVDASLFWPYSSGEEAPEQLWASVHHVSVDFDYRGPHGKWYLQAEPPQDESDSDSEIPIDHHAGDEPLPPGTPGHYPPGYRSPEEAQAALQYEKSLDRVLDPGDGTFDSDKEDFRRWPNDEVINPLLEGFGRGIARMPALKFAELTTRLETGAELFVCYYAPGKKSGYEEYMEEGGDDPTFPDPRIFVHMDEWRPSEKVSALFKEVARRIHGLETSVTFIPWQY
ncbi:hypothetical protein QBC35DRAFT_386504 [Podospora australis]|uniref:F-box domain-containing protein n=1 Tax=Podospora australis TaxID=1536484 RepID=A0AAN7AIB7_9PEZI|nr:hypothetical protein QBC35DRAFT_386504 [Podospora australis]